MAQRGQDEVKDQGHVATGAGLKSIEGVITNKNLDRLVGAIMSNDYMVEKVDPGVPASQVPISGSARRRYIDQLLDWAKTVKPGLVLSERIRFVQNTARVHPIEGIPTKASKRFARNGRRTGWIAAAFEDPDAVQEFEELTDLLQIFTTAFEQSLEEVA